MTQQIGKLLRILTAMLLVAMTFPTVAAESVPTQTDYPLGAGDELKINVFDHPELQTELRVSEGGSITFPLIGEVKTAGLSVHQLERTIARALETGGFVRQAQVSVLVEDFQSQHFSVLGQVAKPGQYPLVTKTNVVGALSAAGGTINLVAADEATLLRGDGTHIGIDLISLFEGDARQNLPIAAGDTLYVPKAAQFYIYGEVQHPGAYRLERRMTVSQAISTGGGLTPRGTDHRVVVRRREYKAGKEKEVSVDRDELVQPDDVIMVKERLF